MRFIQALGKRRVCLVAVVILVALIGSLTFFHQVHQEGQASMIPLRPGWKVIAAFSGTGSKSINQHIALPDVWGSAISCTGGNLDINMDGAGTEISMGKHPCSTPAPTLSSPQSIEYDIKLQNIETLRITTGPTTSWWIELVQESKPSTFQIGAGWVGVMGMGGAGGPAEAMLGNVALASRIWGLVGVCVGEGTISARFTPGTKMITFPACDGQPRLMTARYPLPTIVQDVEVTPSSAKSIFSTYVVACVDEQQCSTQPFVYSTPVSALSAYCTALKEKNAQLLFDLQPDSQRKLSIPQIQFSFHSTDQAGGLTSCTINRIQANNSTASAVVSLAYKDGAKASATFLLKKANGSWQFTTSK